MEKCYVKLLESRARMENKKKLNFYKVMEYLFLGVLLATGGSIVYFNLSDIRCSLDPDFANTIYHYMEVIKHGTLMLPDWHHTTSLELDGTMLFALPLYFVLGNMFKAIGISNILVMFLYVIVIARLLKLHNVDKLFIFVTLILVLTPYEYGMLDYFNMLFYGGACYAIKTIVPILLLLVLSLLTKETYKSRMGKVELVAYGGVYLYLLFATAFSTGIFVVLCGIIPIFVWMILEMFFHGSPEFVLKKKVWCVWIASGVTFVAGYLLHDKVYTATSRTNMNLTNMGDFADNFDACVRGIFELMGAIVVKDVPVLSARGIVLCVKMVLVAAFLVALLFNYFKFDNGDKEQRISGLYLKNYLSFMFVWVFMVMFIADMRFPGNPHTEYRYFVIGMIPLIMLFGIQLNSLNKVFSEFQKKVAYIVLLMVCLIVVGGNHKNVLDRWDRSTYAVEFTEYVETLDVESVIFLADPDSAVMCKGIDNEHKYGTYMPATQSLNLTICSYYDSAYGHFYDDRHILAVIEGNDLYQCMPAEIASQYVKVDKFKWFDIYFSEVMMFP